MKQESANWKLQRQAPQQLDRRSGFTLLEVLVAVAIIALAGTLLIPNLFAEMQKQRVRSFMNETTNFLLVVKQEAIRRSVPVVVQLDLANDRFFAFANVDGDTDLRYQPVAGELARTVDYEVRRLDLPTAGTTLFMDFYGPTDSGPREAGIVDGLNTDGDSNPVIVFEPDGSVRNIGGVRFADWDADNFFELRIAPAATARVQLLKYNESSNWDGPNFLPRGSDPDSGEPYWRWK